ncbi:MAG: MFS transporter [Litorivicinus sp.]
MNPLISVSSLLLSGTLLHVSGGLQGLLMPIRAQAEGFDVTSISLMGSTYAIGFLLGCLIAPRMIQRVGHARAYTVVAAIACVAVGWVGLWIDQWAWIVLRSLTGFAFASAATVAESWLNEKANQHNRGTIFGYYTASNFIGLTLGHLLLTVVDPGQIDAFLIAAMLFAAALIPTALTRSPLPQGVTAPRRPNFRLLKHSPVGALSVLIIGLGSSAFGTLAPVYTSEIGLSQSQTAGFMTVALIAGALGQIPVGWWSDRGDRRRVLAVLSFACALCACGFVVFQQPLYALQLALAAALGATLYTLYGITVALVTDQIGADQALEIAGLMLILFGTGAVLGPLLALPFKMMMGPAGLFGFILLLHTLLAVACMVRLKTSRVSPLPTTEFQVQRPGAVSPLLGEATSPNGPEHRQEHAG